MLISVSFDWDLFVFLFKISVLAKSVTNENRNALKYRPESAA